MTPTIAGKALVPDFLVIGVPLCGTGVFSDYLGKHPDVFLLPLRGPHLFATDLPRVRRVTEASDYSNLFENCPAGALVGETSKWYLFSRVALPQIIAINPDIKLIVLLRNPIDMASALHCRLVAVGDEEITDFEDAWHFQFERRRLRQRFGDSLQAECLQYRTACSTSSRLERLIQQVGYSRLIILIFEEVIANPRSSYLGVLSFLGLRDDRRAFPFHVLPTNTRCSSGIGLELSNPAVTRFTRWRGLGGYFEARLRGLRGPFRAGSGTRGQGSDRFRSYLAAEFSTEVERIEKLLGRPLPAWRVRDCFSPVSDDNVSNLKTRASAGLSLFQAEALPECAAVGRPWSRVRVEHDIGT